MSKISDANHLREEIIKDLTSGSKSRKDSNVLRKQQTSESSAKQLHDKGNSVILKLINS